jgi:hypothetical protein
VVKEDTLEIVGLHWGADRATGRGYACKIENVEADLGISLFWPIPQISTLAPSSGSSKGGDQVTITGLGFQLASLSRHDGRRIVGTD